MRKKVTTEVDISSDELAKVFVHMGSDEQADFFNSIGKHFKSVGWDAEMQVCYISDDINKDGKDFIFTLANFIRAKGIDNPEKVNTLLHGYKCDDLRGG